MTPPSTKMDDSMRKISPTPLRRPQCCRMQTFKRAGILLVFHLLNVLVAISGVICVALLLASMLLMPIWLVAVVIIVFVASILDIIQHIENKCLKYCAYAVVVILYLASLSINWYMTVGPYAVVVVGVSGVGMFFLFAVAVKFLMKIDVTLVNFVATDDSNVRDPDECQDRFNLSETTDGSYVLPHSRMTRHVWIAFAYLALIKLMIGVLSAAVMVVSVILPALVLFSGSNTSVFGAFSDNSTMYTVLVITVWLIGVAGVPVVAMLSVKVTLCLCDIGKLQTEVETGPVIPVTPTSEITTTQFTEINPSTPAVAVVVDLLTEKSKNKITFI